MNDTPTQGHGDLQGLFEGTFLDFLGFKLTAWQDGFVRLEMPVRPEHRNTFGYLHGGVIASLLDVAGALSGNYGTSEDSVSVTINMNTSYMSPMKAATVVAEGELVRRTRSLFFAQAKILDPENNRLVATSMATYKPQARERQTEADA